MGEIIGRYKKNYLVKILKENFRILKRCDIEKCGYIECGYKWIALEVNKSCYSFNKGLCTFFVHLLIILTMYRKFLFTLFNLLYNTFMHAGGTHLLSYQTSFSLHSKSEYISNLNCLLTRFVDLIFLTLEGLYAFIEDLFTSKESV